MRHADDKSDDAHAAPADDHEIELAPHYNADNRELDTTGYLKLVPEHVHKQDAKVFHGTDLRDGRPVCGTDARRFHSVIRGGYEVGRNVGEDSIIFVVDHSEKEWVAHYRVEEWSEDSRRLVRVTEEEAVEHIRRQNARKRLDEEMDEMDADELEDVLALVERINDC